MCVLLFLLYHSAVFRTICGQIFHKTGLKLLFWYGADFNWRKGARVQTLWVCCFETERILTDALHNSKFNYFGKFGHKWERIPQCDSFSTLFWNLPTRAIQNQNNAVVEVAKNRLSAWQTGRRGAAGRSYLIERGEGRQGPFQFVLFLKEHGIENIDFYSFFFGASKPHCRRRSSALLVLESKIFSSSLWYGTNVHCAP